MSGTSSATAFGAAGPAFLRNAAEVARPAERPIVVLEARAAAVWRIGEGLVGGGVCLREEIWENGRRGFVVVVMVGWILGFGTVVEDLGWERREAADFEVRVEGPLN